MDKKNLTLFEAAALIAGLGVGGGVMAVPQLAALNGIIPIVAVAVGAYFLSLLLHLMVAEMVVREGSDQQLVELFGKYLFRGRFGKLLTWVFFLLVALVFYALLAGYLVGCGEILVALFNLPLWVGEIVVYGAAAGVVFFGIKAIGLSEKVAVLGVAAILLVLSVGSFAVDFNQVPILGGSAGKLLALYGMIMFGFSCFFSIPQAVEGLGWNKKLVPRAVALGIGINLTFVVTITVMSLLVSETVSEVAVTGWCVAIGPWALYLGGAVAFMAMLTSYWSVSYALSVIIRERLKLKDRVSWLIATAPTVLVAISGLTGFLGFMKIAGGAVAVMVAILVVPAWRRSRQVVPYQGLAFQLDWLAHPGFQVLVIAAYVLMAAGSVVSVEG
ncbi:MAG: aromatic amino acid transport family protein [Myxococcota bacterium]|nr:aromatic amino acid transport family protein [Myxococcota bacterium]